ncbi:hypothetical protein [Kitasatospora sp. NPDC087315]|uniref:hypothetical protein n=1 Tax=Kitasatospora sp. NPDC087315 TaxID=3364069 RepID=UPI00381DCD31
MTRTTALEIAHYWPRLAMAAQDHPEQAPAMCAAFLDMRHDDSAAWGLDLMLDELLADPLTAA